MQIGYLDVVPARTPLKGRPNVRLLLLHMSLWPCVGAVAVSLILRILSSQATALGLDSSALSAFPLRLAAPVVTGARIGWCFRGIKITVGRNGLPFLRLIPLPFLQGEGKTAFVQTTATNAEPCVCKGLQVVAWGPGRFGGRG